MEDLHVGRFTVPAGELSFKATRASGKGGQNVNKVATKVELRFDLKNTLSLAPAVKARLVPLAGRKLDAEGVLRVTSQRTRDQSRNLEDAREKLRALISQAMVVRKARRKTKPSRSQKRKRLDEKRKQAGKKAQRRSPSDE